ncbi:MAG: hypothetical protein WBG01_08600 [Bacteroidota bacterium]
MALRRKSFWILSSLCLFMAPETARSAFEPFAEGARSAGRGEAVAACAGDAWIAFLNPAALPTVKERMLGLTLVPDRFGLRELGRAAFVYVEPFPWGGLSLGGTKTGFELYRELAVRVACGVSLPGAFQIGIALTWYHLWIARYGSAWTVGVDAGLRVVLSDGFTYGVTASNINAPVIGSAREKLPQAFSTGIMVSPLESVHLSLDLAKDVRFPASLRMGVEISMLEMLALRCGTSTDPSMVACGLGVTALFMQIDYAMTYHSVLGMTHFFTFSLSLE